jgi:gliding motility-associated-like protein
LKGIIYIGIFFCLLSSVTTSAQSYLEFVENKGQWDDKTTFKGTITNGAFALQKTGYRFLLHNNEDLKKISGLLHGHINSTNENKDGLILRSHVYEVKFVNANPNPTIVAEKPINTYNNYYQNNDPSKWASNCKIYTTITYKNIYPNIDVRYYTENNRLKYDFIVNPGADVSKILLYIDGADDVKTKNGDLIIKTSVDEIKELAPYSYQLTQNGKKEIACSYAVKGNYIRFKLPDNISKSETLVIDPTLIFSTFTGSTTDNWGYTATYDASGNFYAGGIAFGAGFPTSNGAFQTTFQGGNTGEVIGAYDIAIMKFNSDGSNRIYATYLGGSAGNEQPHSLIVDSQGDLIVAGRTSSSNFPTTLNNYGTGGGWDITLTKFNASGTALINSLKIGGSGDDGVNILSKYPTGGAISIRRNYGDDARSEVIVDGNDNVYLANCTQSAGVGGVGAFPVTAGAAQTVKGATPANGRYQDGVVMKFTPNLSNVLFSTLVGGGGDDATYVLALNPLNNNIYVAGATESTDLPGNFSSSIFPSNQGGFENIDGFITVLSNDGSQFLKTTYIGTNGIDVVLGIQFDKFNYPYIMGTTTGNWPIINAAFHQTNGKQFLAKLQPDLSSWIYSTVFGTNQSSPNISPVAFLVDRCENVYVSGWGGGINAQAGYVPGQSTIGLTVTQDAIKLTTDGDDLYFFVLEKNAQSQLYGSFFGQNGGQVGEHVDGGTSRFDKNGIIYQSICANCEGGAVFPTTPGVWSPNNGSTGPRCNLAAIKIAFNFAGVGSAVQSSIAGVRDTSGCVPLTVTFKDTIAQGTKYIWRFGDGSPDVTTIVPFVQHTYNLIGNYPVRLISIDSSTCNISDSSYTTLRVRNDDAALSFTPIKQLPCQDLTYNFINNSVPPASKPFKPNSFRWDFGDNSTLISGNQTVSHNYASAGNYIVKLILIDTNYCNEPDTVKQTLRVAPLVKAKFDTPLSGCLPYNAIFTNNSLAGTDFTWDFGDGSPTSTSINATHFYGTPGTYTVKLIAVDTSTCNKIDSIKTTITVSPNPTSGFTFNPNPPQTNFFVTFTNTSSGANNYKWLYGDGDSLITTDYNALVRHIYNATQKFNACLIVTNAYSCSDTACLPIQASVIPIVDVPNAFTPNGDGKNDIIYVQGFGIEKMVWRIYNRWGTLVFTGISVGNGWDGKYKGSIQPQDVYNYVLDVQFSDGSTYTKKGDITLLK